MMHFKHHIFAQFKHIKKLKTTKLIIFLSWNMWSPRLLLEALGNCPPCPFPVRCFCQILTKTLKIGLSDSIGLLYVADRAKFTEYRMTDIEKSWLGKSLRKLGRFSVRPWLHVKTEQKCLAFFRV